MRYTYRLPHGTDSSTQSPVRPPYSPMPVQIPRCARNPEECQVLCCFAPNPDPPPMTTATTTQAHRGDPCYNGHGKATVSSHCFIPFKSISNVLVTSFSVGFRWWRLHSYECCDVANRATSHRPASRRYWRKNRAVWVVIKINRYILMPRASYKLYWFQLGHGLSLF